MFAPLEKIKIASIYGGDLPERMAMCSTDFLVAIQKIAEDLASLKTRLVLSDLYRSYDMQLQAHLDYVTGKKKAYSPPPGGSMHEAGRAFDMDLGQLKKISLRDFWKIAEAHGVSPIIDTPSAGKSEAWHFDRRGSHALVQEYYRKGHATNFSSSYEAMAASAIVSTGQKVDRLGNDPLPGYIQSGLIRLGQAIGNMDGRIGPKTRAALTNLGIDPSGDIETIGLAVEKRLQEKFPEEYFLQDSTLTVSPGEAAMFGIAPHTAGSLAAYEPGPANKAKLGRIYDSLATSKRIEKTFALQPKFIAVLPGGALYLDSELQLDTDGWPEGKGKGDKHWQPATSLRYADGKTSINSNEVPYIVLPGSAKWVTDLGISLGDYAAVLYKGVLTFAVFADRGPTNKIGEGSLQLLRELGQERIKADGKVLNAGAGPGIITIVFPGSGDAGDRSGQSTLLDAIRTKGRSLYEAIAA